MLKSLKNIKPLYWFGGLAGLCLFALLCWGALTVLLSAQAVKPAQDQDAAVQTIVAATMNSLPSPGGPSPGGPSPGAAPTQTPEPEQPTLTVQPTAYLPTLSSTPPASETPYIIHTQTSAPTEMFAPEAGIKISGTCNCGGPDLDCRDFKNQAAAQTCYRLCGGPIRDPFGLDAYQDGIACENYKYK